LETTRFILILVNSNGGLLFRVFPAFISLTCLVLGGRRSVLQQRAFDGAGLIKDFLFAFLGDERLERGDDLVAAGHRAFHLVLNQVGDLRGGFHAARHGATSEMMANGVAPTVVQKQMRHSDAKITLGIYGHVVGNAQREAVEEHAERIEKYRCSESIGADSPVSLLVATKLVGAVGIEIASLIYKSHRTKHLTFRIPFGGMSDRFKTIILF
jgi:Phage integrase family